MRITTSNNYFHDYECPLRNCLRHYCDEHRLLWRDCDSAVRGIDGDFADGRGHFIYDMGECPECEADTKKKKYFQRLKAQYPKEAICPICFQMDRAADTISIHLMDAHGWDNAHASLWLRDEVERMGGL